MALWAGLGSQEGVCQRRPWRHGRHRLLAPFIRFFFSSPFTVVVRPSREPWSALSRPRVSCTGWARAPWPTWPCAPLTRSSEPSRCGSWVTRPASARGLENGQVSGPPRAGFCSAETRADPAIIGGFRRS